MFLLFQHLWMLTPHDSRMLIYLLVHVCTGWLVYTCTYLQYWSINSPFNKKNHCAIHCITHYLILLSFNVHSWVWQMWIILKLACCQCALFCVVWMGLKNPFNKLGFFHWNYVADVSMYLLAFYSNLTVDTHLQDNIRMQQKWEQEMSRQGWSLPV